MSRDLSFRAESHLNSHPPSGPSLLRAFFVEVCKYAGSRGATALLLVLAGSLLEGVGLIMLIPLLGVVMGSNSEGGWLANLSDGLFGFFPSSSPTTRLILLLFAFGMLIALRAIVLIRRDAVLTDLQAGFVTRQRIRIIELLASSRWSTVARLRQGRVSHILGSDIYNLRTAAHFLAQGSVAAVMLTAHAIVALLISPWLAVMVLLMLLTAALALRPLLRRARSLGRELSDSNLALANNTLEFVSGLKISLSQSLQHSFVESFRATSTSAARREVLFAKQRAATQAALTAAAAAIGVGVLFVSVTWLNTPAHAVIALMVVLARMTGPALQLHVGAQNIFHSLPAFYHLKQLESELLAGTSATPKTVPQRRPKMKARQPVEFRSVSYKHGQDAGSATGGLSDFRIKIAAGEFIGITGTSGSGKTTFADLLVGLFPPQSGVVLVGDKPLTGEHLEAWKNSISYVSQDPFLYHDTIRGNLLWAKPDASDTELWDAIRLVGADELVAGLPAGFETVVGDRGCLLSGGERQKIALARALIRRPILLLLDEATSAIDTQSEAVILDRLSKLPARPTIIMIAHRQSSLAFCDRVIEIEKGQVADDLELSVAS
jgi:ATP-binding cassette, subfamily C, bacterial